MEVIFKNTSLKFARFENLYKEANNTADMYVSTGSVAGASALRYKAGTIGNHVSGIAGKTLKIQCSIVGTTAPKNYLFGVLADSNGMVKTGYGYGDAGFGENFWTTGITKEGTTYTKVITIPADVDDLYFTVSFSSSVYWENIVITIVS